MTTDPNLAAHRTEPRIHQAFTLIELIGLLAVIAILAAILVPNLIRQMDRIAAEKESAALKKLSDALKDSIVRNRYIPTHTNWTPVVAAQLGVGIANVATNGRNRPRFFLVDPAWRIGTTVAGQPYQQTSVGAPFTPPAGNTNNVSPTSVRLMILSSIGQPLTNMASGVPSASNFNAIWDWNDASATPPSASILAGLTRGDDLRVQRLNVFPLFSRLILTFYGPIIDTTPFYSIDSTNGADQIGVLLEAPPAEIMDSYFIQGSTLNLFRGEVFGFSLDSQQVLVRDSSYVYNEDKWRNSLIGGRTISGLDFYNVVDKFLSSSPNLNIYVPNGTNQQAVIVTSMITYMQDYLLWKNTGWTSGHGQAVVAQVNMVKDVAAIFRKGGGSADYYPTNPIPNPCPP